tara:strand:+ start:149 stop:916 length:768 start_codon:yes stop_codon:yes gene_type:complete
MKKIIMMIAVFLITACNQNTNSTSKGIQWGGENEVANNYIFKGIFHWYHVEWEKAYTYFTGALEEDPTLFAPHVMLAWLSSGETREMNVNKAKELVSGKNENSQLFVSMLDMRGAENREKRHAIWKEMHERHPSGGFIHNLYANSTPDLNERISATESLLEKRKSEEGWYIHLLNTLGYLHYNNGNQEKAKSYFDEYVESYPEGYNPHDSMGEYYYMEEDYETSLIHYEKALSKFPMSNSANNKVKELKEKLGKK